MKSTGRQLPLSYMLLGASVLLSAAALFLGGCRGNTTAAATVDHVLAVPPLVIAAHTTGDIRTGDPLTNPLWQKAAWQTFVPPAGPTRPTAPTRAAVLYDEQTLYVAFICQKQPPLRDYQDVASVFLDTLGTGTEFLQITLNAGGTAECTWFRTSTAAVPLDDGSPNMGHPVTATPKLTIKGLWSSVTEGMDDGRAVWTAELAIPIAGMPQRLQVSPKAGSRWKFNLLRDATPRDSGAAAGGNGDQLQSNLSAVFPNAQPISPYRMADLEFAGK